MIRINLKKSRDATDFIKPEVSMIPQLLEQLQTDFDNIEQILYSIFIILVESLPFLLILILFKIIIIIIN